MKKVIFISLLAFFALSLNTAFAQNDSIYVMRNGSVIWKYKFSDIDSIIYYNPDNINIPDTPIDTGTLITGTFTDPRDGYEYSWVQIGSQIWMAENLRYLPSVVNILRSSDTIPYCYVHGYYVVYSEPTVEEAKTKANYITYGALYNWTAAMNGAESSDANPSGVQGICPDGWHLPSDAEWKQLEMYLGMTEEQANGENYWRESNSEGGKLKETSYTYWFGPNIGATNETGFTALPGGTTPDGTGPTLRYRGFWWSATCNTTQHYSGRYFVKVRELHYNERGIFRSDCPKSAAYSIRCVKD